MGVYECSACGTIGPDFVNLGSDYPHILYSPTIKPQGYGCFEVGTEYDNAAGGQTEARIFAADWCTPIYVPGGNYPDGTPYSPFWAPTMAYLEVDDSFFKQFVRVYSNGPGFPEYQMEEDHESDGKWHIYLYDVNPAGGSDPNGQKYIDETPTYSGAGIGIDYSPDGQCCNLTAGSNNPGGGWSLFETHYDLDENGSDCPSVPMQVASGERTYPGSTVVPGTAGWNYEPDNTNLSAPADCFASGAYDNYYIGMPHTNDSGWLVESDLGAQTDYRPNETTGWPDTLVTPMPPTPNPCTKNPRLCE